MANEFYNRGATFNPDELADGDAIEAEFDAVARGFDTIGTNVDANKAGYPTQTFHVAPATEATHAARKEQLDTHINDQSAVHGATSVNAPGRLVIRDENGDIGARTFVGDLQGIASVSRSVSDTAPNGASATLVYGAMAGNDAFRILITGTDDGGLAEIATADNGSEPIYVRQYTGEFTNIVRTLTLLDGNGNTTIPGVLFIGGSQWIEYGSNANGEYYRFADGTQICVRVISASAQSPISHAYAASFITTPIVIIGNDTVGAAYSSTINVNGGSFSFISNTSGDTVKVVAIGRWK